MISTVKLMTKDGNFATLMLSLISEKGYSTDKTKELFKALDPTYDRNVAFLKVVQQIVKYEGFNPREIASIMLFKHRAIVAKYGVNPELIDSCDVTLDVEGTQITRSFTNTMEFGDDVQFLCTMFITRGAAFEKIMKKGAKHMQDYMNILNAKYDINTTQRKAGSQLDSTTITYARIAASFPCTTVKNLFHRGYGRCIFELSEIFGDTVISLAMMSSMPSILVKRPDSPLALLLAIAIKTDNVLHQVDPKTSLNRLYTFFLASYNSNATTEPVKAKMCAHWAICDRTNFTPGTVKDTKFLDEIVEANQKAKAFISSSRSGDPFLQELLRKI